MGRQEVQGHPDRVVQDGVPALRPVQGVRRASRSGSTPWFSTDQPYVSNQAAFIGTVITVPSPSRWRPVMPTTPPQVRCPTTGPSFRSRKAAVIMSPSEEVASSARATTGPRGALDAYETGWALRVRSQPRIVRVSFSTTSSLMCPPALPRTSTIRAGRDTSRRRSRLNCAQPEPPMSGMCR